ncbi:hypothetical protein KKA87_05375 [bacterium]|nr:hypothetical protein [bacterium]
MELRLKGGVIIIGSLLWEDNLDKDDKIRLNWRNCHLDLKNKIYVKVPIRYGKESGKNNIPIATMVFSNKMRNKKGFCYVVPFKRIINNIDELLCEAVALSVAEGMKGNFVRDWGVLSYLFNDSLIGDEPKKEIVRLFRKRKNDKFNIEDYRCNGEISCLTEFLKLDINWLEPVLESDRPILNTFHFLLATATKPTKPFLRLCDIAKMVKTDNNRRYYLNNLMNGIFTYDDFNISELL